MDSTLQAIVDIDSNNNFLMKYMNLIKNTVRINTSRQLLSHLSRQNDFAATLFSHQ